ncbi:MAG: gamma-glutamyltransferase [Vicinamibacterales bacterium]
MRVAAALLATLLTAALAFETSGAQSAADAPGQGLREPAWSPDGRRLALVLHDRIWTMRPGGEDSRPATPDGSALEREPAWSPDGARLAYAADAGRGFDIHVVPGSGGTPRRVTDLPGDERWPAWTPDGRLVFSHRAAGEAQWDLLLVSDPASDDARVVRLTRTEDSEWQARVSPDGRRLAFASDRDSADGDFDIWVTAMPVAGADVARPAPADGPRRLLRAPGPDAYPAWSPDGARLAFYGVRGGAGATWVMDAAADGPGPRTEPVLVSRHAGTLSWSPDGTTLAVGEVPDPEQIYNGNPLRDGGDPPAAFELGPGYSLWLVNAPRRVDAGARPLAPRLDGPPPGLARIFERVWSTLGRLYYPDGEQADAWEALRARYAPRAAAARTEADLEAVVDALIADQPLVKPAVVSGGAVVVSGHPLASAAGQRVLEMGGNVVDAAIAVSFALGIVEPDASGLGGDGQALLFLAGMDEPTVVDFKDQAPAAASADNARMMDRGRIIGHGPAAANIPGTVAGMQYLFEHYGSGRVAWPDLLLPAIQYAERGFVLDSALPTTIAAGRQVLARYRSASRLYMPGGRVPRAGDRFVNREVAVTLRTLASEGGEAFYRGSIARRIAQDMLASGGLITEADLAQYRAIERRPVQGQYRGHRVYTVGPPVSAGVSLLEALQVMEHYEPRNGATAPLDPAYWHHLIEAWKMRDQVRRIADPERWPVEFDEHLQAEHAAARFALIAPDRAQPFPVDAEEVVPDTERLGTGTSAFVVVDAAGNMISVTQTLSTWGGSFYATRGLGFLYNNHLRTFRTTPGLYGRLMPLARSNTANVPTLVFGEDDGRLAPRLALGAAGNAWIPASVYSILAAVLDGGLSTQRAVEAPRFLVAHDPARPRSRSARIAIEDRFPRATLEVLMSLGHRFQKVGRKGELRYGYAAAASVNLRTGQVEGGADPRRSHAAVAVDAVETAP